LPKGHAATGQNIAARPVGD